MVVGQRSGFAGEGVGGENTQRGDLLSEFIRQTLEKCLFDHKECGFWRKSMASQESVWAKLCINDE
jgi:hypothetical protein